MKFFNPARVLALAAVVFVTMLFMPGPQADDLFGLQFDLGVEVAWADGHSTDVADTATEGDGTEEETATEEDVDEATADTEGEDDETVQETEPDEATTDDEASDVSEDTDADAVGESEDGDAGDETAVTATSWGKVKSNLRGVERGNDLPAQVQLE